MHRPKPPLNFIRSFECAARHLSFTLAAEELGYTQAAISMHVRSLEKYLGHPLFLRFPRSLKLTEMGEAFLPTLRQGLRQIDLATETIVSSTRKKTVIVACPMSLAENWMVRCLAGFADKYPDIEIVMHGTIWDADIDSVADIVISVNRDDEIPERSDLLWEDRVVLVCAQGLAKHISSSADIKKLPKIYVLGRQDYWEVIARDLGLNLADNERGYRTNASNIALEMAANGIGLTDSPASLAQIYLQRGILIEPFTARPRSPWNYYIKAPNCSRNGADAKVLDWIVRQGAEFR